MPFNIDFFPVKQLYLFQQLFGTHYVYMVAGTASWMVVETIEHIASRIRHVTYLFNKALRERDPRKKRMKFNSAVRYHVAVLKLEDAFNKSFGLFMFTHMVMAGAIMGYGVYAFTKIGLKLLSPTTFLRVNIANPGYAHIMSFRRQVFIAPLENTTIPNSILINYENTPYRIFLSLDNLTCFKCKKPGHISSQCTNEIPQQLSEPPIISPPANESRIPPASENMKMMLGPLLRMRIVKMEQLRISLMMALMPINLNLHQVIQQYGRKFPLVKCLLDPHFGTTGYHYQNAKT
ncbi:unnamed protein product [Phaedon cochleariae]|uniref:CCHC-type domain-containing protein n=1 Tax=Phaedon cochleariae TaxID=80249 RepID=A0A9N9X3L6_PHACE|nr:unnamed protein product [Phaedon cochleariae]